MHGRVQRLHPAVEALREAGDLLDRGDGDAGLGDARGRWPRCSPARRRRRPGPRPAPRCRSCRRRPAARAGWGCGRSSVALPRSRTAVCQRGHRLHQELALHVLDPLVQASPRRRPGRTATSRWASTGPVSTPASTRCTVAPVTVTPAASASRTACAPGKAGSSAGWVLISRPPNASSTAGPTIFMKPAETTRSGSCGGDRRRQGVVPGGRGRGGRAPRRRRSGRPRLAGVLQARRPPGRRRPRPPSRGSRGRRSRRAERRTANRFRRAARRSAPAGGQRLPARPPTLLRGAGGASAERPPAGDGGRDRRPRCRSARPTAMPVASAGAPTWARPPSPREPPATHDEHAAGDPEQHPGRRSRSGRRPPSRRPRSANHRPTVAPATRPASAGTACDTNAISGTAWVSGRAASSGKRRHGAEASPRAPTRACRTPTKKPGPAARPRTAAAAFGSSSSAEPEQAERAGPRTAQRAGQRRVPAGVRRQRDRDDGRAERQRGEQAGEHAAQQRTRRAGQPVEDGVEHARLAGHPPADGRPPTRTAVPTVVRTKPDPGARIVEQRRRAAASERCSGDDQPRPPGRRPRRRSGRAAGRAREPARERPQAMPRVSSSGASTMRSRPDVSSPPWASTHSRPASAIEPPTRQPAGGVERLDDHDGQAQPDQARRAGPRRRGQRPARSRAGHRRLPGRPRCPGAGVRAGRPRHPLSQARGGSVGHAQPERPTATRRTRERPLRHPACRCRRRCQVPRARRTLRRRSALTRGGAPPPGCAGAGAPGGTGGCRPCAVRRRRAGGAGGCGGGPDGGGGVAVLLLRAGRTARPAAGRTLAAAAELRRGLVGPLGRVRPAHRAAPGGCASSGSSARTANTRIAAAVSKPSSAKTEKSTSKVSKPGEQREQEAQRRQATVIQRRGKPSFRSVNAGQQRPHRSPAGTGRTPS